MRIVYIVTRGDSFGGAHVHVRDLSLALRAQGDEAVVLAGRHGVFTDELAERGIPHYVLKHLVRDINPWHDVAALVEIRSLLKRLRPDLVSTHGAKAGWSGPVAAWSLGIPSLQTSHGWCFTAGVPAGQALLYRWLQRFAVPFTDRLVNVCEYDRQLALRLRLAPPEKLVTVRNGMPDVPRTQRARPGGAGDAPVRLMMIARFAPQKDHATLFHALSGLMEYPWELSLIGDGPLFDQAGALAARLGIAARVNFMGMRHDVAHQLAEHHVFLLVTNWEGLPRSILEAMRAGLPVIATDVAGVRESVVDGTTGFLVPHRDVEGLRARLAELLRAPELRARMGAAGRRHYEEGFTLERMFEATVQVYRDLLGTRVRAPESRGRDGRAPARAPGTAGTLEAPVPQGRL